MPKITCICDTIIPIGDIPSPNQLLIISDSEFDNFQGQVDAEELFAAMKLVIKCPSCERLHIFWNGFNDKQTIYKIQE